jgi:hypothetical protein
MARIRTIKPEFFTSEDIVSLSPLARLLYIALWCEADREGRLVWKPRTFKMRYFPGDKCDIDALSGEILDLGLVVQYGECYAYIPTFHSHQHLNPRESKTQLPIPDIDATVTRSPRVSDAQVGREGKEREGKDTAACAELSGFANFWESWPTSDRKQAKGKCLDKWKSINAEMTAELIVSHVERMKQSDDWKKQNGAFILAPLTYLNQRRWEGASFESQSDSFFAGTL